MVSRRQFLTVTTRASAFALSCGSRLVSAFASSLAESADWPRPVVVRDPLEVSRRPSVKMRQVSAQTAAAQGVRRLESRHLLLWTDLPVSESVDILPALFDLAVSQYAQWLGVEWAQAKSWQPVACLMRDRSLFSQLRLLPSGLPNFLDGYSVYDAFWCVAQKTSYYQRTLLFHEGVHGFMVDFCGGCGAPWFMEGWAEFLATHRWTATQTNEGEAIHTAQISAKSATMHEEEGGAFYAVTEPMASSTKERDSSDVQNAPQNTLGTLELGVLPASPFDTTGVTSNAQSVSEVSNISAEAVKNVSTTEPISVGEPLGWGRIRTLQELVKRNRRKTLLEVMQISASNFDPHEAYAWSWAAAYLLVHDPLSRDVFLSMNSEVQRTDFTAEFLRRLGDDTIRKLEAEWFVFLTELEYGMDYERSRVDFSASSVADGVAKTTDAVSKAMSEAMGTPLPERWTKRNVSAERGWVSTGLTVQQGDRFQLAARGRVSLCVPEQEPNPNEHRGQNANEQNTDYLSHVESEANGISIHYHRGQPRGKLLLTVATVAAPERFAQPIAVGTSATLTSLATGTIFMRVNDSSAFLAENQGNFEVALRRQMAYTESNDSEKI